MPPLKRALLRQVVGASGGVFGLLALHMADLAVFRGALGRPALRCTLLAALVLFFLVSALTVKVCARGRGGGGRAEGWGGCAGRPCRLACVRPRCAHLEPWASALVLQACTLCGMQTRTNLGPDAHHPAPDRTQDAISHVSHVGGFLMGLFVSLALLRNRQQERPAAKWKLAIERAVPWVAAGLFVIFAVALPAWVYTRTLQDKRLAECVA